MANNTEDVELEMIVRKLSSDLLDNQYHAMRGSVAWERANLVRDEAVSKAIKSIQQEADRQKIELLEEIESHSFNIKQEIRVEQFNSPMRPEFVPAYTKVVDVNVIKQMKERV